MSHFIKGGVLSSYSSSKPVDNINNNSAKPVTYFKTCEWCNGTGKRESGEFFDGNTVISTKCLKCGRTDTHSHRYIIDCPACSGKGKIKMKKEKGILGEMEMRSLD